MISSLTNVNFQQLQLDCMVLILETCECMCVYAPFSSLCNQVRAQQFI